MFFAADEADGHTPVALKFMAVRAQFERDGFYVFRAPPFDVCAAVADPPSGAGNVLGPELVEQLTAASDASLGEQDASHFEDNVSSGSMILIDWDFFNSFVSPE